METLYMTSKYRHKTTSVTLINYHFFWIPKRRKKVLTGNVAIRLEELLYEKSKELDCEILALEIMEDHVHLFLLKLTNSHYSPISLTHGLKKRSFDIDQQVMA